MERQPVGRRFADDGCTQRLHQLPRPRAGVRRRRQHRQHPRRERRRVLQLGVYKHPLSVSKNGKSASFIYDGLGRRIVEQDATGTHDILWDGSQLAARGDSRTDASAWHLEVGGADIDDHIASIDNLGRGAVHIYHQGVDQSVLAVTDSTGLAEAYTYSAYGEVSTWSPDGTTRTDSQLGIRFLYHGQLFDPWTRTYSMRAREYRPAWGRFLSTDPIGLDGASTCTPSSTACPSTSATPWAPIHESTFRKS